MNEQQEEMLAECFRWANWNPHIGYGLSNSRFGKTPPFPKHCDCSGFTHSMYEHVGIPIGYDTGDIARKTARENFRSRYKALPGDLMMHRQGPRYDGGSDEHVGIFVRYEGNRTRTYESAGSGHGVGYYSRASSWWTDTIRVPALFSVPDVPHPPEEDDMTDSEKKLLFAMLAKLDDKVGWLCAGEIEGGYDNRAPANLRTPKIQKKVGA